MKTFGGKIDTNDLVGIVEQYGEPVGAIPAPWSKGRPHFNVSKFLLRNGSSVSVFHIKPVYYEHRNGQMRPLSEVTLYHGNKNIILNEHWTDIHPRYLKWLAKRQRLFGKELSVPSKWGIYTHETLHNLATGRIGLTTTEVFPDPDTETTTFDGKHYGSLDAADNSWATERALTDGGHATLTTDNDASEKYFWIKGAATLGNFKGLIRSVFLFDTSSIPDADTISAATFGIVPTARTDTRSESCTVILASPSSNTVIALADFDAFTFTEQTTSKTLASFTVDSATYGFLDFSTFTNISKTGVSKFGFIQVKDLANSPAPTSEAPGAAGTALSGFYADEAGTTKDPKLTVTHAALAATYRGLSLLGVGQ